MIMTCWPVPDSYSKRVPSNGEPGSFWEDRADRHHCGVDIYAPKGSEVLSIENGKVLEIGIFTSPEEVDYWNKTYYILILNEPGSIGKYAELEDVRVKARDIVYTGQLIGHVGSVLNAKRITVKSPSYIQSLKKKGNISMLHFELYTSNPVEDDKYLGSNWFGSGKPENLGDPTEYLESTEKIR